MIIKDQYTDGFVNTDVQSPQPTNVNKNFTKFNLLPIITQSPRIVGQPINNFSQTTWKQLNDQNVLVNQDKRKYYLFNTVTMAKNTAFKIIAIASNPANTADPYSLEGLTFVWKRNGVIIPRLQFTNTTTLEISEADCLPSISGIYTCEVTNQYGTTVSEPITLRVVDLEADPIFNRNLIANGSGDGNTEGWDGSDQFVVQELLDYYTTDGFGSVNRKGKFKFSWDSRLVGQNDTGSLFPCIIGNENPIRTYASFFPSIYSVQTPKYNLENNINYFNLGLNIVEYSQDQVIKASQVVDISDYYEFVDNGVYGASGCGFEFFNYIGGGILNYEMVINNEFTVDNLYPSTEDYNKDVVNIKFRQVVDSTVTCSVEFRNINGELLERNIVRGPSVKDITAVTNPLLNQQAANSIDQLIRLIPYTKIDFTKLIPYLTAPGETLNLSQEFYKLPVFRFPIGEQGWNVDEFTFPGAENVSDIGAEPANNFGDTTNTLRFNKAVVGLNVVTLVNTLDDPDGTNWQQQRNIAKAIKERLVSMEVMLDMIAYGMRPGVVSVSSVSDEQDVVKTMYGLYMACLTTIEAQLSTEETSTSEFQRLLPITKRLLDLGVEHQDKGYIATIGEIYRGYLRQQLQNPNIRSLIDNAILEYNAPYVSDVKEAFKLTVRNFIDNFSFTFPDIFAEGGTRTFTFTEGQKGALKYLTDKQIDNSFTNDFEELGNIIKNNVFNRLEVKNWLGQFFGIDLILFAAAAQRLLQQFDNTVTVFELKVDTGALEVFTNNTAALSESKTKAFIQIQELIWSDLQRLINYYNNDYRFRKLCTMLRTDELGSMEEILGIVYDDDIYKNEIKEVIYGINQDPALINNIERSYVLSLFPAIKEEETKLKVGYLKMLQYDVDQKGFEELPFSVDTKTIQPELFYNYSPNRTYSSYTRGAAAFFGYHITGSIPVGARTAKIEYTFNINNKNIAKPAPENWPSNQVSLDGYGVYSVPRSAVVGATMLMHPIKAYERSLTSSISIQPNNNWYKAKELIKNIPDKNLEIVYDSAINEKNIVSICNNRIADFIDGLNDISEYLTEYRKYNESVFDENWQQASQPVFFQRSQIPAQIDLAKYPFVSILIDRYERLNRLINS